MARKKNIFSLLMLSAMYENGGNTTHRLLDGHPELFVYPFESQPGTKYVNDYLSSLYPVKYRWPVFPLDTGIAEMYEMILDEECKVRAKTPQLSKFRDADFQFLDGERKKLFIKYMGQSLPTRSLLMEAFFVSTFQAWKNTKNTGKEKIYVGYSPIIGIDGNKIIDDFKGNGYVLHIVRNPFSAYADTKKRPVPLSLSHYMLGWTTIQHLSLICQKKYPENYIILRYEDIIADPKKILGRFLKKIGVSSSETLSYLSWNGEKLSEVYPWGTVRIPTEEVNLKTACELDIDEIQEIYNRTEMYLKCFSYEDFYKKLKNIKK